MEITKEILKNKGIDPALYSQSDLKQIGDTADRILSVGISDLLNDADSPIKDELLLRDRADTARVRFNEIIAEMRNTFNSFADLCPAKKSIFSSELSSEEMVAVTDGATRLIVKFNSLHDAGMDCVAVMYNTIIALAKIQNVYNKRLYDLGLLNVAATITESETGKIYEAIESSFERFNSITEFINDLDDRAVIGEEALEIKIGRIIGDLFDALGIEGEGGAFNAQKVSNTVSAANQLLTDIIER